jgi:hypothetical protein
MPRLQTPKGYYTSTEAQKILGISPAMLRVHVQKERISYLLPEGRKQGFYLKKDVDKLASELNIFLNLNEEEPSKFVVASVEDLIEVGKIAKALFATGENESSVTPIERLLPLMLKNPEIRYVLKQDGEVVGYISMLPFKQETDKVEKLLRVDLAGEMNITPDDIETFDPGKHIQLYIVAIGVKPGLSQEKKHIYGFRIVSGLIDKIVELGKRGVVIETITALGATHSGIRLLQVLGFSEMLPPAPGKRAFCIKVEESGAPLSMQYKQALKESGVLEQENTAGGRKKKKENILASSNQER